MRIIRGRRPDERGSLPLAMMVAVLGLSISGMLGSALLSQVHDVRRVADRSYALGSAEAGLQVALGYIRAASGADNTGNPALLPCGVLEGAISSADGNKYKVEVLYFGANGGQLACPPAQTPSVVKLKSWDLARTVAASGAKSDQPPRVIEASYPVRVPNVQVPMGLIRNYPTTTYPKEFCLDAGSPTPAAGASPTMQICDPSKAQQKFAYVKNMSIARPKPDGASTPDMCLEATRPASGASAPVTFQPCVTELDDQKLTTKAAQLWSLNKGNQSFEGTDNPTVGTNGWCLAVQYPGTEGSRVVYKKCGNSNNAENTMQPDSSVGAGRAGDATEQLVNYQQFGRCLDVTGQSVTASYLIAWPCGTNPNTAKLAWNQRFVLPPVTDPKAGATGRVRTNVSGVDYCLRSPLSNQSGKYVTITPCAGAVAAQVTWTRYVNHKDDKKAYTLVDSTGLCLEASKNKADQFSSGITVSKIIVAKCDAANLYQKWNATLAPTTGLTNVQEK